MKKLVKGITIVIAIFFVGSIIFNMFTYTTKENEYAVVKQFGKIKSIKDSAGISFKAPILQTVSYIPKAKQLYDLPQSEVITSDKKTMIVNAYVIWDVTDAKTFTQSLNASKSTAEGRIDIMVYNAIKTTISSMTQEELIASRDDELEIANAEASLDDVEIKDIDAETSEEINESNETNKNNATTETTKNTKESKEKDVKIIPISSKLTKSVKEQCKEYGIEISKIEIKVLDLPNENKEAVYNRMITERNNIAAAYTAQGQSEAQIIKNTTDAEVNVMLSEAEATAEATIAEGEAEYMKILSDAYNDPDKADFYLYSLSLDAAKESLVKGDDKTTLFISSDSPIAQIFQGIQ